MPELPEVESVVRGLRTNLPGRRVADVRIHRPDLLRVRPEAFRSRAMDRAVLEVERRGKNILILLDSGDRAIVNLGMTGRLVLGGAGSQVLSDLSHVAVELVLDSNWVLVYDDVRRFGVLEILSAEEWEARDRSLGPEPLDPHLDGAGFHAILGLSRSPIRNLLLDQRRIAGIGNIYANEALSRAGVHPARPARSLSAAEADRLLEGAREVLTAAIAEGGTTLRDYRNAEGMPGKYRRLLRVYGREGAPCPACGVPIQRIVISNRSAFFCPRCQRDEPGPVSDPAGR